MLGAQLIGLPLFFNSGVYNTMMEVTGFRVTLVIFLSDLIVLSI